MSFGSLSGGGAGTGIVRKLCVLGGPPSFGATGLVTEEAGRRALLLLLLLLPRPLLLLLPLLLPVLFGDDGADCVTRLRPLLYGLGLANDGGVFL